MQIIIVGCGKVGYTIAHHLSEEGNDIVVIDKKTDAINKVVGSIDVMTVKGNGLTKNTLNEATVKTADLIICVTNSDETNILCCITAKKLGAKYAIARVRDPEYAMELYDLKQDLGLDMIINPEQQAAMEISRLLRFPQAADIDTFIGGRVELISFRVEEGSLLHDRTIQEIFRKNKAHVLAAVIERNGDAFIPGGGSKVYAGDTIRVLGRQSHITDFFRYIAIYQQKVRDVMIIGGGKITHYLGRLLANHNIEVKIVEIDPDQCDRLNADLPNALVINGDGTDDEILNSEDVKDAGAVVCLTDRDEENVIVGLYAKQVGVPKTIVKINHINLALVKNLDVGSVICPKNITAYQIIRYVRGLENSQGSSIKTLYKIAESPNGALEALEFDVRASSRLVGKKLKDLRIRKGILVGCISRAGTVIIPTGDTAVENKDTVILLAKNQNIGDVDDILEA